MKDLWIKINRIPFWVKMWGMSVIMFVFFQFGPIFSFPKDINMLAASLVIVFSWFVPGFFYSIWDWSINNKRTIAKFLIILMPLFLLLVLFLMNLGLAMLIEIFSYTNYRGDLIYISINNIGYISYVLVFLVANIILIISFIIRLYKSLRGRKQF